MLLSVMCCRRGWMIAELEGLEFSGTVGRRGRLSVGIKGFAMAVTVSVGVMRCARMRRRRR